MFDQAEAFLSLLDRFKRYWAKRKQAPAEESVASRFLRLFAAHGVHRNQIPRFFGHGLQLRDVQEEATLMHFLTDAHLADACDLFGVERQWLERGEGHAHKRHHFYLQPVQFGRFLDGLLASKNLPDMEMNATLFGVLASRDLESSLVLSEPIGLLNEEVIYRYHFVDGGPLGYWKARVSAAALVAQAINRNVWVIGRLCDTKLLRELTYVKDLVGMHEHELLMENSRRFEVEDWLLEPAVLLEGLDPERNNFGVTSALKFWLQFNADGLTKIPYSQPDTEARFAATLEKATG
ncbi:hypothetical protein [Polaromonas sp. SM01]|uniref:hypothetical protein n=1 Tax=Polaromonas sp. SM01 TaxID=3085630 RepID=UPI0029825C12|nr:hypothetical protein [Polaromonas sp. SM01]MDW5441293.1 hypothetical protein [Polaromonas sp. SM01]